MMKKEYMMPTIEVVEINMNVQILAGSVTDINTGGLDDPPLLVAAVTSAAPRARCSKVTHGTSCSVTKTIT